MTWRPMHQSDLPRVKEVSDICYAHHMEDEAALVNKFFLYAQGCFVFEQDGRIMGYTVTHPWSGDQPPVFNRLISAFPDPAPYYFIHDIAILPEARGRGAGFDFFRALCVQKLADYEAVRLVAITPKMRNSCQKIGFRMLHAPCPTYGNDSAFMELRRDGQNGPLV